jgi:hypothetical protein
MIVIIAASFSCDRQRAIKRSARLCEPPSVAKILIAGLQFPENQKLEF